MNIRDGLDFIVQCKWPGRYFESIAAFNDSRVAKAYVAECEKANSALTYRVRIHVATKESTSCLSNLK